VVHADKLKLWGGEPLPSWLEETCKDETEKEALKEALPDQAEEVRKKKKKVNRGNPPEKEERNERVQPASYDTGDREKRPVRQRERPRRLVDYV
jgi:hypothetical protein